MVNKDTTLWYAYFHNLYSTEKSQDATKKVECLTKKERDQQRLSIHTIDTEARELYLQARTTEGSWIAWSDRRYDASSPSRATQAAQHVEVNILLTDKSWRQRSNISRHL